MADFKRMIPFIFHFAAGVYGKNGSDLEKPLEEQFILARRSGWSDDKDDDGGATMIDVTLSTYHAYCISKGIAQPEKVDLRMITFPEWSEILKGMYWDVWKGDEIESQGLANLLVDWVWASGSSTIRRAQEIIGVKADGIVGPKTLAAINSAEADKLFGRLYMVRERYYRNCKGAWKFLPGWLRRLRAIQPDGSFLIYDKQI